MCHNMADPLCGSAFRTEDSGADDDETLERAPDGLGPFLLVKVSAIMNAWVHMQCALWSPEVSLIMCHRPHPDSSHPCADGVIVQHYCIKIKPRSLLKLKLIVHVHLCM